LFIWKFNKLYGIIVNVINNVDGGLTVLREIEYCRKYLNLESGSIREVAYYITVDEIFGTGEILFENYGVRIRLDSGDEDIIRGITVSGEKINLILQLLSDGTVTPIGLRDVIYDMLEVLI
jgi:hypothetical protein